MEFLKYASDFVSFIISNINKKDLDKIKQIIFFPGTEKNIVFFDIQDSANLRSLLKSTGYEFFTSAKYRLLNIADQISIEASNLEQSKHKENLSEATILYAPLHALKQKQKTIFSWESPKQPSSRVLLNKRLFGYNHHGKFYPGLVQKYSAEKLGTGVIIVNSIHAKIFSDLFEKMKISTKRKEVIEH